MVYGVETRALNQAVKRNAVRFPEDFAFRLTPDEARDTERSRSQSVILKRGRNAKYAPLAFTEYGAIMAANVLNSTRAVRMSIVVVRAFVGLRQFRRSNAVLVKRITALERKCDGKFAVVFQALRELMAPPAFAKETDWLPESGCRFAGAPFDQSVKRRAAAVLEGVKSPAFECRCRCSPSSWAR